MALFALISAAWLAVVFFGVAMCRLGARSDHSHVLALAEWIAHARGVESEPVAEPPGDGLAFELGLDARRATG